MARRAYPSRLSAAKTQSMSRLSEHFGRTLAQERRAADLSVEELGFLCSMHRTAIEGLERGARVPRLDTIIRLAGGLEVETCDLLAGMRWRPGRVAEGGFEVSDEPFEEVHSAG